MGSYSPIAAPSWNVIALSVGLGVLLGAVLAGLIIWQDRHEKRRTQAAIARNRGDAAPASVVGLADEPPAGIGKWFASLQGLIFLVAMIAGAIGLPSVIVHQWLVSANALLDTSEGTLEAVEIEEMIQVTHAGIFREYKIEYRLPARGEAGDGHSMLSTPDNMSQFEFAQAVAVVKQGAFGWEWVSEIIPLQQVNEP